jgi:hypothetical protein
MLCYTEKKCKFSTLVQGCKLLSDIGQCPTKFGKCPSKSNFDRTLVRSQKKFVTYTFLLWQNPIANSLNLHFAIKFTRHSSILRNVAPEWLYILVSGDLYISCDVYCICPTKFSGVGFCPTKFKLCPTKIKSNRTNVLSSQIFICSPAGVNQTLHKILMNINSSVHKKLSSIDISPGQYSEIYSRFLFSIFSVIVNF